MFLFSEQTGFPDWVWNVYLLVAVP